MISIPSTPRPSSVRIQAEASTFVQTNPFSYKTKVYDWGGRRWVASVTIPPMTHARASNWIGFFTQLEGVKNTFKLPLAQFNKSLSCPNPRVNGVDQTGSSITITGLVKNSPKFLLPNAMINIGDQLFLVTEGVSTDMTGSATISVIPKIKTAFPDGTIVEINNPFLVCRLSAPSDVPFDVGKISNGITFSAVEDKA